MAGTPRFKVYSPSGEYVAACWYPSDAAAIIAIYGEGATIRDGHTKRETVWEEGVDGEAGESYDVVAETVNARVEERSAAIREQQAAINAEWHKAHPQPA